MYIYHVSNSPFLLFAILKVFRQTNQSTFISVIPYEVYFRDIPNFAYHVALAT